MNKLTTMIIAFVAVTGMIAIAAPLAYVGATPASQIGDGVKATGGSQVCTDSSGATVDCFGKTVKTIVNVMLFLLGALAVIMIVIGGIRYTVSGGDSGAVTSAKNTIMYAIVGLIVALLGYAIVNFVIKSLG